MTFFEARPHYCNWPCRFNDGRKGYRLLGRLVGVLKLWVTAFFTFVAYEAYRGGRFSYAVAVVFLAVAVVAVCVFAVRLRRAGRLPCRDSNEKGMRSGRQAVFRIPFVFQCYMLQGAVCALPPCQGCLPM